MTTDEMGSRYYGIPDPTDPIPDYAAAMDDDDDERTRPENQPKGGDCAMYALALLICVVVIPVAVTAVFIWKVG